MGGFNFLGMNFDPIFFMGFMLGFVIGTTIHEFMHAFSALKLGDTTAQQQGRVTLSPFAHFDPFGFIMGVLLALGVPLLAWGRPVPVNPSALRFGRRGMAIVAFAGPLSNLVLAGVLVALVRFGRGMLPAEVSQVMIYMIYINLLLFAFNLIPIPPLDGYNILVGILPNYWVLVLEPLRRYSLPILMAFIFVVPYAGRILGINLDLLGAALDPVRTLLVRAFLGPLV